MQNIRIPLTEKDLNSLSHGRVSIVPGRPDVHIVDREVQIPIQLMEVLNPHSGVYITALSFTNCIFLHPVDIGLYTSAGRVIFKKCQFHADVSISSTANVTIVAGCYFAQNLTIQEVSQIPEVGNFTIDGELLVHGNGKKLILSNINSTIQAQKLVVKPGTSELQIIHCFFKRIYVFPHPTRRNTISVHGSYTNRMAIIAGLEDCHVVLNESELQRISISGSFDSKISMKITYCKKIRELILPMSRICKAEISYCEFNKLQIWEASNKSDVLTIENSTVNQLLFWRFINEGLISLRSLTIPEGGTLGIHSSNLGRTEFITCDFSQATLEFENSRLTEVFVAETDFPVRVVLRKEVNHVQAQLAFGQLRTAFDKQGDTVRALEYQSREIEAHYHNIRSFWRKRAPFLHFTKLNLGLNRLSNDFGRDWGRGIVFAIVIGLTCFAGLVWTTQEYSIHGHWQFDHHLIASFVRFMNPLRFFDLETLFTQNGKQPYVTLTWGSYVMDFLGRISLAYAYYQTIQAFRRYGRK